MSYLPWKHYFPYWDMPKQFAPQLSSFLSLSPRNFAELEFVNELEMLPKIELHVHLEAAVPREFYADLNKKYALFDEKKLPSDRSPFLTLREFIKAWLDQTFLIEHEVILQSMAKSFVSLRAKHHIKYSEVHVSPFDLSFGRIRLKTKQKPLDFKSCLENYLLGIQEGMHNHPEIDVRLIIDTFWLSTNEECLHMHEAIKSTLNSPIAYHSHNKEPLILGIGLGGQEKSEVLVEKSPWIEKFRDLGLKIDLHCGENTSEDESHQTILKLTPDRISHGIAPLVRPSSKSPGRLFEKGITACPISNCLTGSFSGSLADHPIKRMLKSNIPLSINTDDPLLFGTNLTLEYLALHRALGLELDQIKALNKSAVDLSFSPAAARRAINT